MTDAVVISELVKTYGRTTALRGINLRIRRGSVHALIGENGAGKSTALGIIAGRISKTSGDVAVFGCPLGDGHPRFARSAGVFAIYQELTIIPALTVEANLFLGIPMSKLGVLSEARMRSRYVELCERIGVTAHPPRTIASDLSVAQQQVIEILRALVTEAKIILFDEPTASLAMSEREALFAMIRKLQSEGVTVVFVSHNLDEVLDLADQITVFRDGTIVGDGRRASFNKSSMIEAMLGTTKEPQATTAHTPHGEGPTGFRRQRRGGGTTAPIIAVSKMTVPGRIDGIEFELPPGAVLGLGGLVGAGRSTVLRGLAGVEPRCRGRMWLDGKEVPWPRSVRQALSYGIALLPEDRKTQGLVLTMSAMDNIALSNFRGSRIRGLISPRSVERATRDHGRAFGLAPAKLRDRAADLSGGNQQKLLLARWRYVRPRILLADEPTRGIDVGAKAEILDSLESMAADGMSVLLVSSELEELTTTADNIVVLAEGTQVGTLRRGDDSLTPENILKLAFGESANAPRAASSRVQPLKQETK